MTRETKVGLLVGVAIILLIGIIVSDYLSVTKDENQPDFTDFANQANRNIVSNQNPIDPEQGTQSGQFHPGNGQQVSNQLTQGARGGLADGSFHGNGQGAPGQNQDRQGVGSGRQGPINTPRDRQIAQQQQQLQQQVGNGGFLTHGARINAQSGPAGSGDSQDDARRQLIDELQRRQNQTQPIIHYVKSGAPAPLAHSTIWKGASRIRAMTVRPE